MVVHDAVARDVVVHVRVRAVYADANSVVVWKRSVVTMAEGVRAATVKSVVRNAEKNIVAQESGHQWSTTAADVAAENFNLVIRD